MTGKVNRHHAIGAGRLGCCPARDRVGRKGEPARDRLGLTTHLAARHEIATEHWRWLHQAYALAEREGLAEIAVGALDSERTLTCHAAYARVLLLHLANPAALAQREFGWAQRWARRWAGKLRLSPTVPDQGGLGVDLDAGSPPRWIAASDTKAHTRRLDCGPIARSIHGRIIARALSRPGAMSPRPWL